MVKFEDPSFDVDKFDVDVLDVGGGSSEVLLEPLILLHQVLVLPHSPFHADLHLGELVQHFASLVDLRLQQINRCLTTNLKTLQLVLCPLLLGSQLL